MSKEYTYDIDKYTIGVDTNGEDGIGLTVAIIKNGEINFLGNCYGENARCIDLLIKENQELKKQLEEYKDKINWYENFEVNKTIDKLRLKHNAQQQEFINYLEDEIKSSSALDTINKQTAMYIHSTTLKKCKEIIGE